MANQKGNYQLLIEKLDQFIRKYYINQLIRGALYSIGLILLLFITVSTLEHFFYFDTGGRKLLFYSFIGASGAALVAWVIIPLLKYFKLGAVISHEQAAEIIGNHFFNVKDKLLNLLQLKNQADHSANAELILASINQKTEEIKLVPFKSAINLSQNKKYLRYALPPLLLLLALLVGAPSMITDSTDRLINNHKKYERPAPFHFKIDSDDLTVVQFGDYTLAVEVEGEALPNEVYIDIDDYQYRLTKVEIGKFQYQFSNVQKDTKFRLFSSGVESENYTLGVLAKPNILGFDVKLDYPAYIQRKDEEFSNIGDLVLPIGTNIDWIFNAQNTDNVNIKFSANKKTEATERFSDQLFTYKKKALKDESYKLYISNAEIPNADSISYRITIIPDQHPTIKAEKFADSLNNKIFYFAGEASDDYGLLSLSFNYQINQEGATGPLNTVKLPKPGSKQIHYNYTWDLEELELQPGDEVTYYFEVFDNDAINGSKATRTNVMLFAMPTLEELEAKTAENNESIKDNLQKSLEEVKKIQEEMKKVREKLLQEKELNWQNKKEIEKLLERQRELEKMMEEAKKDFEENLKNQEESIQPNEQILEKQEKLQKLFDELMSDEMKELMQKMEELLQKMEKEDALEMLEDMEMSDEELEKELDRMEELFKQLEMEYEQQQQIDKLEKLAEEQEELAEETEENAENTEEEQQTENQEQVEEQSEEQEGTQQEAENQQEEMENKEEEQENKSSEEQNSEEKQKSQEELEKEQEEINKKFEEIQKKNKELEQKNQELEFPMPMQDQEEQMEDIQQDLQDSKQQLQQKQNKKAAKSQKKAAQKMRQMAQQMQQQMQSGEMEQMEEDMAALRQLLENLVGLSFDQEDLINKIRKTTVNTPKYVAEVQQQYKLKDDFKLIEDSLQALSKRVFQIESFVTEKVTEIKTNMKESLKTLEERKKPQANDHQQRTMKNVNDLALMLSEVMDQMQQQMSSMMAGSQMCSKPGMQKGKMGKVPMDKISKGQKSLNDQMQQMKDALERAKNQKGQSKQFAQMAAKQAALRKALQEAQKQLQEQGKGSKELQDIVDEMDKIETELVNKRLTNEMMKRQEEILTRLLEAEKAEREREYDNKRKAETAAQRERKFPPSLEEYIKKREAEIDMYKSVSPVLRPYYKILVEEYFKELKTK